MRGREFELEEIEAFIGHIGERGYEYFGVDLCGDPDSDEEWNKNTPYSEYAPYLEYVIDSGNGNIIYYEEECREELYPFSKGKKWTLAQGVGHFYGVIYGNGIDQLDLFEEPLFPEKHLCALLLILLERERSRLGPF